jgi:peptide/nickel transport system permease protein
MGRFVRRRAGVVSLSFIVFLLLVAAFGTWLSPYNPDAQLFKPFLGPSSAHLLGTDDLGRDMFSRLIVGTRVSIRASFQTVGLALVVAVPLGLIAGYLGGWVDNALLRIMDAILSFPALILALVVAAVLGPGLNNAMIAITIALIPTFVRIVRGQTLAVSEETFVEASRAIGTPTRIILRRRILPSVLSPLIVTITLVLGFALLAEAALSFLGLGVQPPGSSWGNMLQEGYQNIYTHPFQMAPPGIAIALAVLAFNIAGDTLRDALGLSETVGSRRRNGDGRLGMTVVSPSQQVARDGIGSAESAGTQVNMTQQKGSQLNGSPSEAHSRPLLSLRDLRVEFATAKGPVTVVDGVSFDVEAGEILGLVGESGSGKTVTSLSLMRLLPSPPARITAGQALFAGQDLFAIQFAELRGLRGSALSMVFQDPLSSLNPSFTIGNQVAEVVRIHHDVSRSVARRRALELLEMVRIPDPKLILNEYPHRLSGGMRQRVLIAMAIANDPKLLIADEPTTALDVTVQAQILDLLKGLQKELGMAMIFVTHDLGVIADICDRVVVMYAGQFVEVSPVHELFSAPKHPYTRQLLKAIPQTTPAGERLFSVPGVVPEPWEWPRGCRFSTRCPHVIDACTEAPVQLFQQQSTEVRCIRHNELTVGDKG